MQLSLHAEYALRVLLYVGIYPDRVISTDEISLAYGISKHHLVRVAQTLAGHGYLRVAPGRFGGLSLSTDPRLIRLGEVVRRAEPSLRLAECFDKGANTCVISPVCSLKPILWEALESFLATLNRYTLADLLSGNASKLMGKQFVTITARPRVRNRA